MVTLYTDGASKGNPGIAGIGYVLYQDNMLIKEGAYIIPSTTNNVAEIVAIIVGLHEVQFFVPLKKLIIRSDSLLLMSQFNKIYKIKNQTLLKAHKLFLDYFGDFVIEFQYIPREFNVYADALANKGIYEKNLLSQKSFDIVSCLFDIKN